jgi:hypothetical protein
VLRENDEAREDRPENDDAHDRNRLVSEKGHYPMSCRSNCYGRQIDNAYAAHGHWVVGGTDGSNAQTLSNGRIGKDQQLPLTAAGFGTLDVYSISPLVYARVCNASDHDYRLAASAI